MTRKLFIVVLMFILVTSIFAQVSEKHSHLKVYRGENTSWWAGVVSHGELMPLQNGYSANLNNNYGNQTQLLLLLSSHGEVIWSDYTFEISVKNDSLNVWSSDFSLVYSKAGETLKEGCLFVSKKYFPTTGKLPDESLFAMPQYNTWIELMYNQNQNDILNYARNIIANGLKRTK